MIYLIKQHTVGNTGLENVGPVMWICSLVIAEAMSADMVRRENSGRELQKNQWLAVF